MSPTQPAVIVLRILRLLAPFSTEQKNSIISFVAECLQQEQKDADAKPAHGV